jgi:hypothetical protein
MDPVLEALALALGPYLSQQAGRGIKASGVPDVNAPLYQSGGLFGRCDGPSVLINAMVGPIGYEGHLDWIGTRNEREIVDALTDISESGSEQNANCGDCVSVSLSACGQFYCFGRFCRQTAELQFDSLGLYANENVPVKALFGNITDSLGNVLLNRGEQITDAFFLQSRAAAYALRLKNSTLLWAGDPVNSNGQYNEYRGFEDLVNSGKFDIYTQLDCDALDSFLLNFQNNQPAADGTWSIQNYARRMVNNHMIRAERAGLDWNTADMDIVMTPNLWDCVVRAISCSGIELCSVTSPNSVTVSGDEARRRHEDLMARRVWPILGREYPVVLDSQITETTGQANGICSDVFFITKRINGEEITYGQYQDFNQTYGSIRNELRSLFGSDDIAITDNGRFALVRDNSRGCFDVQVYTKPRIVARMPWLLGRIQNVCCSVLGEPFPDVTGSGRVYEKDGGRTSVPVPTLYGSC